MSNIFSFEAKKVKSDKEKEEDHYWDLFESSDIQLNSDTTLRIFRNNQFLINYKGTEAFVPATEMEVALALRLFSTQKLLEKSKFDIKTLKVRLAKLFLIKSKFSKVKFRYL